MKINYFQYTGKDYYVSPLYANVPTLYPRVFRHVPSRFTLFNGKTRKWGFFPLLSTNKESKCTGSFTLYSLFGGCFTSRLSKRRFRLIKMLSAQHAQGRAKVLYKPEACTSLGFPQPMLCLSSFLFDLPLPTKIRPFFAKTNQRRSRAAGPKQPFTLLGRGQEGWDFSWRKEKKPSTKPGLIPTIGFPNEIGFKLLLTINGNCRIKTLVKLNQTSYKHGQSQKSKQERLFAGSSFYSLFGQSLLGKALSYHGILKTPFFVASGGVTQALNFTNSKMLFPGCKIPLVSAKSKTSKTSGISAPFFGRSFDKSRLKKFVRWFVKRWGLKKTIKLLDTLKFLGFKYAKASGISLSLEDLYIPSNKESVRIVM